MIPMPRAPVIQISRRALLISSLPKSCGGVPFLVLRDRERETGLEGIHRWEGGEEGGRVAASFNGHERTNISLSLPPPPDEPPHPGEAGRQREQRG